jgi:hypothetical protein
MTVVFDEQVEITYNVECPCLGDHKLLRFLRNDMEAPSLFFQMGLGLNSTTSLVNEST